MSSQGAGNGGGQGAGQRFVSFTKPAAQRIAKVVRTVEAGNRTQPGVEFDHPIYGGVGAAKLVRVATFTGSWAIGNTNVVTFTYAPTATASAVNLSWPITHNHTLPENCIVGKEGTSWWLVVPVLQTVTTRIISGITSKNVISDIDIAATLDTSNCSISVAKTLHTTSATFVEASATSTILRLRVPT